jgi:Mn2+/Fe2+ NRAMP family transporter
VQTRAAATSGPEQRRAVRYATIDSTVALCVALFINVSILIVAAASFFRTGHTDVAELADAYDLLAPLLGSKAASVLFGVALLAAGQSSTLTGTIAGQVVMEGFLQVRTETSVSSRPAPACHSCDTPGSDSFATCASQRSARSATASRHFSAVLSSVLFFGTESDHPH